MATQATMNGGTARPGFNGPDTLIGNITEFGSDVATLAELQAKLAVHDLKETAGQATLPAILLGSAGIVGLGAVPVLLFGIAEFLVASGLSRPWSFVLTGLGAIVLSAGVGFVGWSLFGKSLKSLNRSREELVRNLNWVKAVVSSSGRGR